MIDEKVKKSLKSIYYGGENLTIFILLSYILSNQR
jgi:hypothetical protein